MIAFRARDYGTQLAEQEGGLRVLGSKEWKILVMATLAIAGWLTVLYEYRIYPMNLVPVLAFVVAFQFGCASACRLLAHSRLRRKIRAGRFSR